VLLVGRVRIPILQPLLQLPLLADAVWRQAFERRADLRQQWRVLLLDARRLQRMSEQVAHDLAVHRRLGDERRAEAMPFLGRDRRRRDEATALRILYQSIDEKLRRTDYQSIQSATVGPA